MTLSEFKDEIIGIIESSEEFIVYDNTDPEFDYLQDDQLIVVGQDDSETFRINLLKVYKDIE